MTLWADVGLRAAEQLEVSVGPYLALASYKRLFEAEAPVRERAVAGALRCAAQLGDDAEIERCAQAWAFAPTSAKGQLPLIKQLLLAGKPDGAAQVARADATRSKSAHSAYVRVRTEEAALSLGDALGAWREVVELAHTRGEGAVLSSAAARYVATAFQRARREADFALPRAELAQVAELCAEVQDATEEQRLCLARARLLAPGKFQRAAALSELARLAAGKREDVRDAAIASALRHAEGMPHHLDAIEWDRVLASTKQIPSEAARTGVARELAELRASLASPTVSTSSGETNPASDVALVTRARARMSPDAPVPVGAFGRARRLLFSSDPDAQRAAIAFFERALTKTSSLPPPSLTALAARAEAVPDGAELGVGLLAEAVRYREPAARTLAAFAARRRGYEELARGDREAARGALREARELFQALEGRA